MAIYYHGGSPHLTPRNAVQKNSIAIHAQYAGAGSTIAART